MMKFADGSPQRGQWNLLACSSCIYRYISMYIYTYAYIHHVLLRLCAIPSTPTTLGKPETRYRIHTCTHTYIHTYIHAYMNYKSLNSQNTWRTFSTEGRSTKCFSVRLVPHTLSPRFKCAFHALAPLTGPCTNPLLRPPCSAASSSSSSSSSSSWSVSSSSSDSSSSDSDSVSVSSSLASSSSSSSVPATSDPPSSSLARLDPASSSSSADLLPAH